MQIIQVKIRQKNKDEADVYWKSFMFKIVWYKNVNYLVNLSF